MAKNPSADPASVTIMIGLRPRWSPRIPPSGRAMKLAKAKPAPITPAMATDTLNIFSKYPGSICSTASSPPNVTA